MEQVILVDEKDYPVGAMEKMEVHRKGLLHRAISVFIFNTQGKWLLQRRALSKYHSAGLWSNTCCSHPYPGESNLEAARRRLRQEMGITSSLHEIFSFTYFAQLDNSLIEHEFDHVFVGVTDELPRPAPEEVMDYEYLDTEELMKKVHEYPDQFTIWFKKIYMDVARHLKNI